MEVSDTGLLCQGQRPCSFPHGPASPQTTHAMYIYVHTHVKAPAHQHNGVCNVFGGRMCPQVCIIGCVCASLPGDARAKHVIEWAVGQAYFKASIAAFTSCSWTEILRCQRRHADAQMQAPGS